jgi:hypothetical protein
MARAPMTNNQRNSQPQAPAQAVPTALPPILQGLMSAAPQPPVMAPGRGLAGGMPSLAGAMAPQQAGFGQVPSYQMGGAIGPGGQPMRPAGVQQTAPQGPMDPNMVEMQIQQFASQNPQALAQIKQAIDEAIMTGELTQQELNTMVQLATTVLRNPALYPQIRQFAIQQGIATEQDLSPEYDQGLIIAILIAARAAQANVGGQNMMAGGTPAMAGAAPIQSMKDGGRVRGEASEPVVIEAHTGEYVIPKHVVDMKGREFFDRMLEQYAEKGRNDD